MFPRDVTFSDVQKQEGLCSKLTVDLTLISLVEIYRMGKLKGEW